MQRRDRARDERKRPGRRIVAGLRVERAREPAAGVAQHDDPARVVRRRGQLALADPDALGFGGNRRVADASAKPSALPARRCIGSVAPVGASTRARGVADDGARVRLAVGGVLEPRGEDRSEEHEWFGSGQRREGPLDFSLAGSRLLKRHPRARQAGRSACRVPRSQRFPSLSLKVEFRSEKLPSWFEEHCIADVFAFPWPPWQDRTCVVTGDSSYLTIESRYGDNHAPCACNPLHSDDASGRGSYRRISRSAVPLRGIGCPEFGLRERDATALSTVLSRQRGAPRHHSGSGDGGTNRMAESSGFGSPRKSRIGFRAHLRALHHEKLGIAFDDEIPLDGERLIALQGAYSAPIGRMALRTFDALTLELDLDNPAAIESLRKRGIVLHMKSARVLEFIERGKQALLKAQREYEQREDVLRRARVPVADEEPPERQPLDPREIVKGVR